MVDGLVDVSPLLLALRALRHVGFVQRSAARDVDLFFAVPPRWLDNLHSRVLNFGRSGCDVVVWVVADGGRFTTKSETPLHRLEKVPDDLAIKRDLDLNELVAFAVHERVRFAAFVVDVLSDVEGELVAFVAESPAGEVDLVWLRAVWASAGVVGECFHHVDLVVTGLARVDGGRREPNLTLEGRHLWFRLRGVWKICRRRRRCVWDIIVGGDEIVRRHFD